jgi:integrase
MIGAERRWATAASFRLYQEHNARNRCLSPEEETRLLRAMPARLRPLVTVALHTGIRRGELCALRWDDVLESVGFSTTNGTG